MPAQDAIERATAPAAASGCSKDTTSPSRLIRGDERARSWSPALFIALVPPPVKTTKHDTMPTRRVSWGDHQGRMLAQRQLFRRSDETWRCNRHGNGPLCPSPVNDLPPTLAFDRSCLAGDDDTLLRALGSAGCLLESVQLQSPQAICTVRVLNVAFEKAVFLRVTFDHWASHTDIAAHYVEGSCNGRADRFVGIIDCSQARDRVEFAICYQCDGREYWDNCHGGNYVITNKLYSPPPAQPFRPRSKSVAL